MTPKEIVGSALSASRKAVPVLSKNEAARNDATVCGVAGQSILVIENFGRLGELSTGPSERWDRLSCQNREC
jgi:hypothetical protein